MKKVIGTMICLGCILQIFSFSNINIEKASAMTGNVVFLKFDSKPGQVDVKLTHPDGTTKEIKNTFTGNSFTSEPGTDSNCFVIYTPVVGNYKLQLSKTGYENFTKSFSVSDSKICKKTWQDNPYNPDNDRDENNDPNNVVACGVDRYTVSLGTLTMTTKGTTTPSGSVIKTTEGGLSGQTDTLDTRRPLNLKVKVSTYSNKAAKVELSWDKPTNTTDLKSFEIESGTAPDASGTNINDRLGEVGTVDKAVTKFTHNVSGTDVVAYRISATYDKDGSTTSDIVLIDFTKFDYSKPADTDVKITTVVGHTVTSPPTDNPDPCNFKLGRFLNKIVCDIANLVWSIVAGFAKGTNDRLRDLVV
ncbi:MAG: hypothetical protein WCW17_01435 [Patescibacteria group bacterium]